MGLDPRRASGSAQGRAAQSMAELEARVARLENSTKGSMLASGLALQTGGSLTLQSDGTLALVPGCVFTTATQVATRVSVTAVAQQINFISSDVRLYLYLDGADQTGSIVVSNLVGKTMNGGSWRVSLSAGNHTLQLYAARAVGSSLVQLSNAAVSYFQTRA